MGLKPLELAILGAAGYFLIASFMKKPTESSSAVPTASLDSVGYPSITPPIQVIPAKSVTAPQLPAAQQQIPLTTQLASNVLNSVLQPVGGLKLSTPVQSSSSGQSTSLKTSSTAVKQVGTTSAGVPVYQNPGVKDNPTTTNLAQAINNAKLIAAGKGYLVS